MSETEPKTPQKTDGPACSCGSSKCKLWIPMLILALIILGFIIVKSDLFKMFTSGMKLKNSDPYQKSLKAVQEDSKVQAKLGKEVEADGWPTGDLDDRTCNLCFGVKGPNGTGKVVVEGRASDKGVWSFRKIEVTFEEGEPIQVQMESQEGELPPAPLFQPGGDEESADNPAGDPANNPGGQP